MAPGAGPGAWGPCTRSAWLRAWSPLRSCGPEYDLDDVKRLQALFDVGLSNGLACVVVDYVNEVCHDAYAVSSDAFEARLMEAEMVVQWCHEALQRSSKEVCAGPRHQQVLRALADLQGSGTLRSQGSKLSGLTAVLRALREKGSGSTQQKPHQHLGSSSSGDSSDEGGALLEAGECLRQAVSVAMWCVEAGLGDAPPTGRHGSRSEWTMRCSGRAKAALERSGSGSLFLSDLCEAAWAQHLGAKYPPASLEEFLGSLFLARSSREEQQGASSAPSGAFKERLGALLYYLEDLGSLSAAELAEALRRGFHLSPAEVSQWRGAFLLDSCCCGGGDEERGRVQEASGLLMGAAAPSTPFKFAEVLSRGFQEHFVALSLLRSGAGVAESGSLSLALAAMDIRLACGLLPEAYLEAGRHCRALGGASSGALEQHREALVRHLLEWAQRHKALHRVLELSLEPGEEEVLRRCLQDGIARGPGGAGGANKEHLQRMLLPLYYLQRGRTPEAMLCTASMAALQDGGGEGRAAGANAVLSCTVQAGTLLPLAQRQLISSGAASASTAASSNSASVRRVQRLPPPSLPPFGLSQPASLVLSPPIGTHGPLPSLSSPPSEPVPPLFRPPSPSSHPSLPRPLLPSFPFPSVLLPCLVSPLFPPFSPLPPPLSIRPAFRSYYPLPHILSPVPASFSPHPP